MTRPVLVATYRLQFGPELSFSTASTLAPYLRDLGISHVYASPVTEARPGSAHGYDGTDPTVLRRELGGEDAFRAMAASFREHGLGLLIDIVPNHLAADPSNPYWMDVLELGGGSAYRDVFDIHDVGDIALPLLSDDPIDRGELRFDAASGRVLTEVNGASLPIRPASLARILEGRADADLSEAAEWLRAADSDPTPERLERARAALGRLAGSGKLDRAMETADLERVHSEQHWKAVHWRSDDLGYRRFFDVTQLIGVRVEDPAIFDWMHRLPLALLREGIVDGFRIDHIDGLRDPAGYCERLRKEAGPDAVLLVEKILGRGERLPEWPVDGTTGYERLGAINELFVQESGRKAMREHLVGRGWLGGTPERRIASAKAEVLRLSFRPELQSLVRIAQGFFGDRAAEPGGLCRAIVALLATFPVYRSYLRGLPPDPADEALWRMAAERAGSFDPPATRLAEEIVGHVLAGESPAADAFRTRFQQLSGPAMAKGVEDTELYRDVALLSVNEVGAEPGATMRDPDQLHDLFAATGSRELTPLATHDTKRGADTRARLDLLSRHAERWIASVERWSARHVVLKQDAGGVAAPDGLDEWLIYQTLFGAWPISRERLAEYLTKAVREAKRHGSWTEPDQDYEAAVQDFASRLLAAPEAAAFREQMAAFVDDTNREARIVTIAQTILQVLLPGVPDVYRGTEIWDHSLVDPDNRRPVPWDALRAIAAKIDVSARGDVEAPDAKMRTIRALLRLRRATDGFAEAGYAATPMDETGWFAFRRVARGKEVLVAVPLAGGAPPRSVRFRGSGLDGRWQRWLPNDSFAEIRAGRVEIDPGWPFVVLTRALPSNVGVA